jgi:hypothetical protein
MLSRTAHIGRFFNNTGPNDLSAGIGDLHSFGALNIWVECCGYAFMNRAPTDRSFPPDARLVTHTLHSPRTARLSAIRKE